jgi:pimeloyl-ACP methyl ester carboxylesterase
MSPILIVMMLSAADSGTLAAQVRPDRAGSEAVASDTTGSLELEPCQLPSPIGDVEALCGALPVPENPDRPEGRLIELNVVVMPALEPAADAVPMFELAGGPGLPVATDAGIYAGPLLEFRRHRAVVLVDHRGTGGSGPLHCPALEAADPIGPVYPLDLVRACRDELADVADLDHYGSEIAAADIDQVREALGAEQLDLWALSYGTILGQTYLRLYPHRVRSAVFVGVAPLDLKSPLHHAASAQRALDLVLSECQLDAACNRAHPDLRDEWQTLLRRFDEGPIRVSRVNGDTDRADPFKLHKGPFAESFRNLLSVTTSQREVPWIIHRAAAGDFEPFLSRLPQGESPYALGLYLSVSCSQGASRIRPDEIDRFTTGTFLGDYRVMEERAACAEWPTAPAAESFFETPTADVPILVISGEVDHVTPPRFARDLCSSLPSCRMVLVPSLAHVPFDLDNWTNGVCLERLVIEFFADPDSNALDIACVSSMIPPPFALPGGP